MMNKVSIERERALSNVGQSLNQGKRFPRNVFQGPRSCFFFDSDRMFERDFVGQVKFLLDIEGGTCACLRNLDREIEEPHSDYMLFIERDTTPETYQALLAGSHPGEGWIYDVERFSCSSDIGQWAMYCERRNEIAVIGFKSDTEVNRYRPLLSKLVAVKIDEAIEMPISYGFSARALSPQWRDEFLREYDGNVSR